MPLDLPELFTIDHLMARYPHLSRDTMYDWLNSGELVGFKLGRVWHVHPDDWDAFLARRRGVGVEALPNAASTPARAS